MTLAVAAAEAEANGLPRPRVVRAVCRRLGRTTVAYYDDLHRRERKSVDEDALVRLVNEIRAEMPFIGVRKLYHLLKGKLLQLGIKIGRDRFFGVLRRRGLLVERRAPSAPKTTKCDASLPVSLNLTKGLLLDGPNQVHVSDITYVRVGAGFAYLSLVTDRFTREVVGWHLSEDLKSAGPMAALRMAMKLVPAGMPVIEHSDRGSQYASKAYRGLLASFGLLSSMTEERHCYENGAAERVNGILKAEFGLGGSFATLGEARKAIRQAIATYNTKRPHAMLGFHTPAEARANPELVRPAALAAFEAARKISERKAALRKAAEAAAHGDAAA